MKEDINFLKEVDRFLDMAVETVSFEQVKILEELSVHPDFVGEIGFIAASGLGALLSLKNFLATDETALSASIRLGAKFSLQGCAIGLIAAGVASGVGVAHDVLNVKVHGHQWYVKQFIDIGHNLLPGLILGLPAVCAFHFFVRRIAEPRIAKLLAYLSGDIHRVYELPGADTSNKIGKSPKYDPLPFFRQAHKERKLFVGLGENKKPIYADVADFYPKNVQIVGAPGTGKGVIASVLIWQLIRFGVSNIIFNPKKDEFARRIYSKACEAAGIRFRVIDLSANHASINPIAGCSSKELYELLIQTFRLTRTGDKADYYSNFDRNAANAMSKLADTSSDLTLNELNAKRYEVLGDQVKTCENLLNSLQEVADLAAVKTKNGVNLTEVITKGECVLIEGDTSDDSVQLLMKFILTRVIQIVNNRDDKTRHVTIFVDELKYLLNKPLVDALGTIRDKNANFIVTHQSLADLEAAETHLPPSSIRNSVIDNCLIKWFYKTWEETADWVSKNAGTKQSYERIVETYSNSLAASGQRLECTYRAIEVPIIHKNEIMDMANFCGVCLGLGRMAEVAFSAPIKVDNFKVESFVADSEELCTLEDLV